MIKKIYIVRHCEATGQPSESPLTEKGFAQATSLSNFFSEITLDQIISSPFVRAIQSVEPLSHSKNLVIKKDERLAERILSTDHLPDWLEKLQTTFIDMTVKFEGGESSKEAMARIVEVVKEVLSSDIKNTIIVTHGNIMSLLLHYFDHHFGFEAWKNLSNPDVFVLSATDQDVKIERLWEINTLDHH